MGEILNGVWAASLTPMDSQLNIDMDPLIDHVRNLLQSGCNGVALFGTTGEANSFSVAEKLKALATVAKAGIDPHKLMIGTGCCAVSDTIYFTNSAIDLGFSNFLVLPPFYYKNISKQGVFNAYAQLTSALPPRGINIIIYDIPQLSGVEITLDLLVRLQKAFPHIIKGVKNSTGDWSAIKAICAAMPGFSIFAGSEQYLLATLRAGGAGCISATANVTAAMLGEIYAAHRTGDNRAEHLQAAATRTRLILQQFPPAPALKQILARACGRASWTHMRPPLVNLDQDQIKHMFQILEASDLILESASLENTMEVAQ